MPLNELIVVTGVSGSGKSSLVFDTLYAEGQRRYVETFSPYARQFLDRMDKPQVDRIDGIPPAIAIDQTNPVRTSRSTVGTMTELNDHLKLLFARAAQLVSAAAAARRCAATRRESIYDDAARRARRRAIRASSSPSRCRCRRISRRRRGPRPARAAGLHAHPRDAASGMLEVVQDRLRVGSGDRARVIEALEAALRVGRGRVDVGACSTRRRHAPQRAATWRFSTDLHCADCDIHYRDPAPSLFSFNSPLGACDTCRGFGRVIGIDYGLVIPDESKTLRGGAVQPWQTESYSECQDDLRASTRRSAAFRSTCRGAS